MRHRYRAKSLQTGARVKARVPFDHVAAARLHYEAGRYSAAHADLRIALDFNPQDQEAYIILGELFQDEGKLFESFDTYQRLLSIEPKNVTAYNNLAGTFIKLGQLDLAVATARAAVALAPDNEQVYLNLALALRLRGDQEESLATYAKVVALKPDHGPALVELCFGKRYVCDWEGLDEQQRAASIHSYRKGERVSPFTVMVGSNSPADQLQCAMIWGKSLKSPLGAPLARYAPRPKPARNRRIRLGYISADFFHHATAMLLIGNLEQHNRDRFELFAYSIGPDDGSAMRKRLVAAFDHFVDLRNYCDEDAARLIHEDAIDVLLDLKGFTQHARVQILAFEPAPIQVNYLGFPATMGVPFIDYIIADANVLPPAHEKFFSEKVVRLPHSYQPNDQRRAIANRTPSRSEFGLPPQGLVLCCFNHPYKITPEVFAVWMRLLSKVPDAVLWLLAPKPDALKNLRRETLRHGMPAERVIFAPLVTAEEHIARLARADLFLDTFPVNAHTTASEALWAGLPLLTYSGETFASRVAGSLLHAVGMPDLVTSSLAEYEEMALTLATDPQRLSRLRDQLKANRSQAPLFDTPRYTRNFEQALVGMVERCDEGLPPESFAISEQIK